MIGRGHSGAAGAVFPMWPYGSFFVRAETGRYGASIDCLEGVIDFDDIAIAFSNLGRRSPTLRIPTPVPAGAPPATTTVAAGLRRSLRDRARGRGAVRGRPGRGRAPGADPGPDAGPDRGDPDPDAHDDPHAGAEGRAEVDQARRSRAARSASAWAVRRSPRPAPARCACARGQGRQAQAHLPDRQGLVQRRAPARRKTIKLALTSSARKKLAKRKSLSVTVYVTPSSGKAFTKKLTLKA